MKNWKEFLIDKLDVEEYYLHVWLHHEPYGIKVRYIKHNGNTQIELTATSVTNNADFIEWFNHYYDPLQPGLIRFGRKKKLVTWAVENAATAFAAWSERDPNLGREKLQKA